MLLQAAFVCGCEDKPATPSPTAPPTSPAPTTPGATPVRGTERLVWTQAGDVSQLRFRAYVDNNPVDLPAATCDRATPAECRSPLPPLTDGVHSIAVVNVQAGSGSESSRTNPISVQKVAASASSFVSSLLSADARTGAVRMESVISLADGLSYTADVVASRVAGPAQLAWLPDGRLVVGDANGQVRFVRPGQAPDSEAALDAHAMFSPAPTAPMSVASHPEFLRNRFVYVSFLAEEPHERTRLRIIRLREAGGTLGEPATLFEAPVRMGDAGKSGPRMAFGPDRLLYVSLPSGAEFEHEPAASTPVASMLRLTDEGRSPHEGPLAGVTAHVVGFTWEPASSALFVMVDGESENAVLRSLAGRPNMQAVAGTRFRRGSGSAGTLRLQANSAYLGAARALEGSPALVKPWTVRLTSPMQVETQAGELLDRVGDVTAGPGGTFFVAMERADRTEPGAARVDVVVRLTPLPAETAR
jgi:hypothetical protein